ncbi:MAG: hydrolase, HAD-superfamily, subfamily [Pseudonocardia sp.]|nr:hydrolase, HAD-superfamily, subfamily [Pseudonocardia sp.]
MSLLTVVVLTNPFTSAAAGNCASVSFLDGVALDGVLFDRDGTLVVDVPYNGDPDAVVPMPTARAAVALLRQHGMRTGVVSNQSGIGRGLLDREQVERVNARVDALLGPFDVWRICPHAEQDGCACRKPAPGQILAAAKALGTRPERLAVIGDIGSDMRAAHAAGARAVLVPTQATRVEEVTEAPEVARDLHTAVTLLLARRLAYRRASR